MLMIFTATLQAEERVNGEKVINVEWEALMPADYSLDDIFSQSDQLAAIDDFDPQAQTLLDEMMAAMQSAPTVPEMNGKMVKVPGYVVPLESEGRRITEFFLVPYFGACIHVPPPPSNQIIHVHFEPGTNVENLYDAVWITGKLKTEVVQNDIATSGYTMEAYRIEPYEL
tara:strand:+ start:2058 stop:2567 length:510 start_codon:yes stop_codon:yes gene_type:complete